MLKRVVDFSTSRPPLLWGCCDDLLDVALDGKDSLDSSLGQRLTVVKSKMLSINDVEEDVIDSKRWYSTPPSAIRLAEGGPRHARYGDQSGLRRARK